MMRELRVEDALLYLDQVKVEFGDRPHIYNEFLDIMKTFKTQQIDTPGVIRRVSNLFQGNRRLVLGFNTFLPEGYKIELPPDGEGPPVAVYRAPGSNVAQVLRESSESKNYKPGPPLNPPEQQQQQHMPRTASLPPPQPMRHAPPPPPQAGPPGAPATGPQRLPPPQEYGIQPPSMQGGPPPPPPPRTQAMPRSGEPPRPMDARGGPPPPPMHRPMPGRPQQHGPPQGKLQGTAPPPRLAPPPPPPPPQQQQPAAAPAQQPLEFDHAINYVTTIKKRFASEPETYKKFLEILHTYQKEQRGIKEVLDEVSTLFADHPDLLKEFTYFLPDAVQAQAKAQLDEVAKQSEARKRAQAKQAIMAQAQGMQRQVQTVGRTPGASPGEFDRGAVSIPFGATQGRSPDREGAIMRNAHYGVVSFEPVRPPRKGDPTAAQAAATQGRPTAIPKLPIQPNTTETTFFWRAKEHLNRKELAADKPAGSRRHTPWTEFLKCLHLHGAGILNREELTLLLKGLFIQGHAPKSGSNSSGAGSNSTVTQEAQELLREFDELLVSRGPYAAQEQSFKDKSMYGSLRVRDFDFSRCENPTPSYYTYPSDYPQTLFMSHPGQFEEDEAVLNAAVACVGQSNNGKRLRTMEMDGGRRRHNAYEEAVFRVEDERYEMDMAIERNVHALRAIEPLAEEVSQLREQEEKDGQPIGRLQYKLNRYALNSIHINAIARIYGERGDEVLQHLLRNPMIVLPIVYQRLKQKDAEWRKARAEMLNEKWNAIGDASYEGCMDVQCPIKRREIERTFSTHKLLEECKRAKTYHKRFNVADHPTISHIAPTFELNCADEGAVLHQPFVSVKCKSDIAHRDAFQLMSCQIKQRKSLSVSDRERIGRIWAEFMAPWAFYPSHWILDEVRQSFTGKLTPSIVTYTSGQRVSTIYGEGSIVSLRSSPKTGPTYRVKLPFGVAHLNPSAILFPVPSTDVSYVRRDGTMVRDDTLLESVNGMDGTKLSSNYQLLFGTEPIYVFLRLYTLLCSLLSDTREHCDTFSAPDDPAREYYQIFPRSTEETITPNLNFSGVLAALKKVIGKDMDSRSFETFCRKVSKDKVHQMAALPKLIERCADALIKVAREDVLLHLYDLCQYRSVDPVIVRRKCLAMAPDALFRIQKCSEDDSSVTFSYLPKSEELRTSSPRTDAVASTEDDSNDGGPMEVEMEDDDFSPERKRSKVE